MTAAIPHPNCPTCSNPAQRSITRFGIRHDHCGLWSWDGAPLVDKETHDARTEAHAAFDTLWTSRDMTRAEAYRKLAIAMQMRGRDCHIKLMDAATARRVVEVVVNLRVTTLETGE